MMKETVVDVDLSVLGIGVVMGWNEIPAQIPSGDVTEEMR